MLQNLKGLYEKKKDALVGALLSFTPGRLGQIGELLVESILIFFLNVGPNDSLIAYGLLIGSIQF